MPNSNQETKTDNVLYLYFLWPSFFWFSWANYCLKPITWTHSWCQV